MKMLKDQVSSSRGMETAERMEAVSDIALDKLYPLWVRPMNYLLGPILAFLFDLVVFATYTFLIEGDRSADLFTLGIVAGLFLVSSGGLALWIYARHSLRRSVVCVEGSILFCAEGEDVISKVHNVYLTLKIKRLSDLFKRCSKSLNGSDPAALLAPITVLRFVPSDRLADKLLTILRGIPAGHCWFIHPKLTVANMVICADHVLEKTIIEPSSYASDSALAHYDTTISGRAYLLKRKKRRLVMWPFDGRSYRTMRIFYRSLDEDEWVGASGKVYKRQPPVLKCRYARVKKRHLPLVGRYNEIRELPGVSFFDVVSTDEILDAYLAKSKGQS